MNPASVFIKPNFRTGFENTLAHQRVRSREQV